MLSISIFFVKEQFEARQLQRVVHQAFDRYCDETKPEGNDIGGHVSQRSLLPTRRFADRVPPLASRGSDVVEIATTLLKRHSELMGELEVRFPPGALDVLLGYSWPGNVRELSNIAERCVLMLKDGETVTRQTVLECGPFHLQREDRRLRIVGQEVKAAVAEWRKAGVESTRSRLKAEIREVLGQVFRQTDGNISQASRRLGLSRSTLYSYLEMFGVGA